ncbi:MAG: sigma 54-dependent Fis family transcriptional regulator [Acidobacteria bacterium]|nr:sigma 54-dependent Fis family transcriptional regulator [Acidobacteriota bacterium]
MTPSPTPRPGHGFRLIGDADGESFDFVLQPGESHVGAAAENDLVLRIAGVSHHHALIGIDDAGLWLRDLGSKNGTFLNGRRVEECRVKLGDIVGIGPVPLRLDAVDADDAAVAVRGRDQEPAKKSSPQRWSRSKTPSGTELNVPARWLGVVNRLDELVPAGSEHDISNVLQVLRDGLGADAVALVESLPKGQTAVRHVAGNIEQVNVVRQVIDKALGDGENETANRREVLLDGPLPATAAIVARSGTPMRALVALGDFPLRTAAGPILHMALRRVNRALGDTPPPSRPRLRRPIPDLQFPEGHVVGASEPMLSVYRQLRHLLKGSIPILITGETGTGKEHVARILHSSSPRASGPLVAVNCAAIPAELLEAELFGIERGVATGVERRDGKMLLASGGTVFLDEIGDMSPALQAKLLRALQEREIHPIGARRPVPFDARIVAATNTDLMTRIAEGRFRNDLYYRVAGYTLRVPALRERRGDIAALAEFFMHRVSAEVGRGVRGISVKALRVLIEAPWPGNVRELEHEVRRLVYLCPEGQVITSEMLSPSVLAPPAPGGDAELAADASLELSVHVEALERRLIRLALARSRGKLAGAARLLGVSRYGLTLKMQRLGIEE